MADWKMGGTAGVPFTAVPVPVSLGGTGNATGDASALVVTPTGGGSARMLARVSLAAGPSWDDVAFPFIVGHRGGGTDGDGGAPENTMAGFELAASVGAGVELDVADLADGSLVIIHDDGTLRTTGVDSPNGIRRQRLSVIRRLNAANYAPFIALGLNEKIPTLDDYLDRFGRRVLTLVEIKFSSTATAAATKVVERGLQDSVVLTAFDPTSLDLAYAVDPTLRLCLIGATLADISPATVIAHHATWAMCYAAQATSEYVAGAKAAGLHVAVATSNDVKSVEDIISMGADVVVTDDVTFIARFAGGQVTPSPSTVAPPIDGFECVIDEYLGNVRSLSGGWRGRFNAAPSTALVVSSGYVTFAGPPAAAGSNPCVIHPGVRLPAGTYQVDVELKAVAVNADTSRYMGVRFGYPIDADQGTSQWGDNATTGNGYVFIYRGTGAVELGRVVAGNYTKLADATWAAYGAAATFTIRITTTSTAITAARVGTASTITANDATFTRAGWVSVFGAGQIPGVGAVSVAY